MQDVVIVLLIDGIVLSVIGILLLEIHRDLRAIIQNPRQ
jgi:hypothetical protein